MLFRVQPNLPNNHQEYEDSSEIASKQNCNLCDFNHKPICKVNSSSDSQICSFPFSLCKEFAGLGGDVMFLKHNFEYQQSVEPLKDVVSIYFVFLCYWITEGEKF